MNTPSGPPLHPQIEPLAVLLGLWRGSGAGEYPTIDSFGYREEVTFGHVGKPFLVYGQKTRHVDTDLPLHAESGYWRVVGGDPERWDLEVVLAHPTGLLESLAGSLTPTGEGAVIDLSCPAMVTTATAVEVTATERRFVITGDTLRYEVAMAAVGEPMTHHLSATLDRA